MSGPILSDGILDRIGDNRVAVPERLYKVILDISEPTQKAIGFVMPNEKNDLPVWVFAVPIDAVEAITGIDFFALVEDIVEASVEGTIDLRDWEWDRAMPELRQRNDRPRDVEGREFRILVGIQNSDKCSLTAP